MGLFSATNNARAIVRVFIWALCFTVLRVVTLSAQDPRTVRLEWDANDETDLGGYIVYYGPVSRAYWWSVDVGNQTTFPIGGLEYCQPYYFVITAYDENFTYESGYSNEVATLIPCSSAGAETMGVFRPSNGVIYLKSSNSTGFAEAKLLFGIPGDLPIAGDWDGDGVDTIGVYQNGIFYLWNSNSTGFEDLAFGFGLSGDLPVAGDWDGDGVDTVGIYRNGQFLLRNANSTGAPDIVFNLGQPGDQPITGDWDGDGVDGAGVFRPSSGLIYLKNDTTSGFGDINIVFGIPGDTPTAGDWDGDGIDTIGVYRSGLFLLRNTNTTGFADVQLPFGQTGDLPMFGRWGTLP